MKTTMTRRLLTPALWPPTVPLATNKETMTTLWQADHVSSSGR